MTISIGQLDLEALDFYLRIVKGFRTAEDPSGDTENVAGIPATQIAKAINSDERDTVQFSMGLKTLEGNEIKAEDILSTEDAQKLQNAVYAASVNNANDMRALRNEMYHLKREMIKSGAMPYDAVYDGFIDPFMTFAELFTKEPTIINISSGQVVSDNLPDYKVGQHAALISGDKIIAVDEITNIEGSVVTFNNALVLPEDPDLMVKTFGTYDRGRFVFGSQGQTLLDTNNQVNMIYKDGVDRLKIAEINNSFDIAGFASTMVVPAELDNNFLNSINLSLRITGAPGTCQVQLFDYNSSNIYDEPVATSNLLNSSLASDQWRTYKFVLDNQIKLEKGKMYLVLVTATNTSTGNTWSVGGFTEECNNLIHQDTYTYHSDGRFTKEGPDIVTNTIADMFIGLTTTEVQALDMKYSKQGLYTGTFHLENNKASRVRISINPRRDENIDFYKVKAFGWTSNKDFVVGSFIDRKMYSHTTMSNGEVSGYEYVYDFVFDQEVDLIEFQVIFDNPNGVTASNYEALYSLVVSTDNGFTKEV